MNKHDSLGDRMKEYEAVTQNKLMKKTPTIIRLDGKAFHTLTKRLNVNNDPSLVSTPFSVKLHNVMVNTVYQLMSIVQNAKFAYTQSDEITIVLIDYHDIKTEQWFNGNIQKIVSTSAAECSVIFNDYMSQEFVLTDMADVTGTFDSRKFNVPSHTELGNNILWRQNDASRNSVSMYARHFFSHKELQNKTCFDMLNMLTEIGHRWEDLPVWMKRG